MCGDAGVYVIEQVRNRWYIGETACWRRRWRQHITGRGSQWTLLHPPLARRAWYPCDDSLRRRELERQLYYQYRNLKGAENVRGAGHTRAK